MAGAIGTLGRLGIGATSPVTYGLDFKSETFGAKQESMNGNGVRGTLEHTVERVRAGLIRIDGGIDLTPQAADYHQLLPWILGGAGTVVSGTNKRYNIAETAVERYVTIDRHAKVFTYNGVVVNQATFSAQQGEFLDVSLDLVGLTETVANAGTFPAVYPDLTTNPLILSQMTINIGGSTGVTVKSFEVTVNNNVDKDRYFNSNNLSKGIWYDREVRFKTQVPYGDYVTLYNTGADTGVAVQATFTMGTTTMIFSMQKVVFEPQHPAVEGRKEVMMNLEGRAYRFGTQTDATKDSIIVTLDTGA